nr:pepsin/retropepsin-like aspartic protease family protein [Saccharophagus degradans]
MITCYSLDSVPDSSSSFKSPKSSNDIVTIPIHRHEKLAGLVASGSIPILNLKFNSHNGLFVLDTGAFRSVLSEQFAEKANIKRTETEVISVRDSAGVELKSSLLPQLRAVVQGGKEVEVFQPLIAPLQPLVDIGVDGVISPQTLLTEHGCININFKQNKLAIVRGDAGLCRLPNPSFSDLVIDHDDRKPMIKMSVLSNDDVKTEFFLLDTGATSSQIPEKYTRGLPEISKVESFGISGARHVFRMVGPVELELGETPISVRSIKEVIGDEKAILGMDILGTANIIMRSNGEVDILL